MQRFRAGAVRAWMSALSLGGTLALLAVAILATAVWQGAARAVSPPALESPESLVARGAVLFAIDFLPLGGLGPLFNATSCLSCHHTPRAGGMGADGLATVLRVERLRPTGFDPWWDTVVPLCAPTQWRNSSVNRVTSHWESRLA